jgi:CHAD domain-containing protein
MAHPASIRMTTRPEGIPGAVLDAAEANIRVFLETTATCAEKGEPDADAVHDARVAGRRLMATLAVLEPVLCLPCADLVPRVKLSIRALGRLRDADVMAEAFAPFADTQPSAAAHLASLLDRRRRKLRRASRKELRGALDAGTRMRVGALLAADPQGNRPVSAAMARVRRVRALERGSVAQFFDRAAALSRRSACADLHQARIAGKRMRYTLEVLRAGARETKALLDECRHLQDELGMINDRDVASKWLARRAARAAGDPRLAARGGVARELLVLSDHFARTRDVMRAAFHDAWTPERIRDFRRRICDSMRSGGER